MRGFSSNMETGICWVLMELNRVSLGQSRQCLLYRIKVLECCSSGRSDHRRILSEGMMGHTCASVGSTGCVDGGLRWKRLHGVRKTSSVVIIFSSRDKNLQHQDVREQYGWKSSDNVAAD